MSNDVVDHFAARAAGYNASSSWCTDDALNDLIVSGSRIGSSDAVLDVACGTGLVARSLRAAGGRVVGLDITDEMAAQAAPYLDELVVAPAESMPFPDGTFAAAVSRQGIQFMSLPDAVHEMRRVTAPGGRVVLANLAAYGDEDAEEYFEVLRLRNPVRRHFFRPDDVGDLLREVGCVDVTSATHVSVEDVDVWSDNGAIGEDRREAIREVYRNASDGFRRHHAVTLADGRITDHMLMIVAAGTVPPVGDRTVTP